MMCAVRLAVFGAAAIVFSAMPSEASLIVQFVGSNPITSPDFATEFNPLPVSSSLSDPQSFDGFTFDQINGDVNGIRTTYNPGGGNGKGWYPNGGDSGYTQIVLPSGAEFGDVGLFVGSGNSGHSYLAFELLNNGSVVASGTIGGHTVPFQWLSITGGVFDTIRLRDGNIAAISVGDGSHNALAFDRVVVATATETVPEPSSLALLGIGAVTLVGGAVRRRRRGL